MTITLKNLSQLTLAALLAVGATACANETGEDGEAFDGAIDTDTMHVDMDAFGVPANPDLDSDSPVAVDLTPMHDPDGVPPVDLPTEPIDPPTGGGGDGPTDDEPGGSDPIPTPASRVYLTAADFAGPMDLGGASDVVYVAARIGAGGCELSDPDGDRARLDAISSMTGARVHLGLTAWSEDGDLEIPADHEGVDAVSKGCADLLLDLPVDGIELVIRDRDQAFADRFDADARQATSNFLQALAGALHPELFLGLSYPGSMLREVIVSDEVAELLDHADPRS